MNGRILVVDDHAPSAEALADALADAGHDSVTAASGARALELARTQPFDVVVTDLKMDGMDGVALLRELRQLDGELPVILVTAHATVDSAVEATRAGAFAFLTKPLRAAEMRVQVRNAVRQRALARAVQEDGEEAIVGTSPALASALATADRVARSEATVLLTGETGTGKELFARRIHRRSRRAAGPFVAVNAGALPEKLMESELFGQVRGAFTGATGDRAGLFEAADGGTLFLDEVGEVTPAAQTRLLRVLQERVVRRVGESADRAVDVRILAATHRDLAEEATFRRDLFFRLAVVAIHLPPLRARSEDVPVLFGHALRAACARAERAPMGVEPEVLDLFARYRWPGNVRELTNVAERAAVLATGDRVTRADLPPEISSASTEEIARLPDGEFDLTAFLEGVEEMALRRALARAGGVKARAAASLGLERNAFRYKLQKYGIPDA